MHSAKSTRLGAASRSHRIRIDTLSAALLALILLATALPHPLLAQSGTDHQWRIFERGEGLTSNDISTVFTDGNVVWVGTDAGIARYDGAWTSYPHSRTDDAGPGLSSGLPAGAVAVISHGEAPGELWAATGRGYVSSWDGKHWRYRFSMTDEVLDLLMFDGNLYVAGAQGLEIFDSEKETTSAVSVFEGQAVHTLAIHQDALWAGGDSGLWQLKGQEWQHIAVPDWLDTAVVTSLWSDSANRIWVGTNLGVMFYDVPTEAWSGSYLPILNEREEVTPIRAVVGDAAGAIWAISEVGGGGARKFISEGIITIDVSRTSGGGLSTPFVRDIAIGDDGAIWFATPIGLFQYLEGYWQNEYIVREGMDRRLNAVNELLIDRAGDLWIATAGAGVRRKTEVLIGYSETYFNKAGGHLPNDGVNALAEDREGGIWVGTFEGPMRFKDDEWQNVVDVAQLPSAVVTDFLASDAGIWIGTEAGLAFHSFADESTSISAELQGVSVEAMTRDGLDRLWVGTRDSGIWIREPAGEWTQMLPDEDRMGSLPSSGVLAGGLVADRQSDAGMWAISVDQALIHWDGLRWQEVDQSSELPSNLLYRLFTDPIDGSLWIGSEAGVTHYDGRTWGTFSADDGLQSTAIYAIALEKEGVYWFGGPEGLTRYRPDRTAPWIRVDTLDGALESETGEILAELENPFSIHLEAGDLQTAQDDLAIFYRTSDADVWRDLPDRRLQVLVDELGAYQYEFVARDRAFNYSPIIGQTLSVVAPPELINLPVLGEVEQNIFWTLVALGVLALLGFGYVSLEIIQTRVRTIRAINRGFNPYVSGEPVRTVDMFFGRHELLQRVVDTLHNNSIMIHGERRIGKTTLLYQLGNVLREVEDPEYWFMPVYLDLEGTAQEDFFHFLIEEIAMAVLKLPGHEETLPIVVSTLRYHTLASDQYSDRDFNHDMRRLIGALHRYGEVNFAQKQLRVILLMDEMDVMSTYDHLVQQRLRRIFMRDFAATLGAIVAGIQISKEWDRVESPWFNLFNEIEVQPFSREQAEELLIEPVRDFYFYELEALDFIIDQSGGRPFRVQQYALEAVNHMLAQKRRRITLEDVQVAHELIQSSDVTHHQQDGLHPVHTAPIDSLQEVIA